MVNDKNDVGRRRAMLVEHIRTSNDASLDEIQAIGYVYSDWTTKLDENYCYYVGKGTAGRLSRLSRNLRHDAVMNEFGLDRRIEFKANTERELLLKEIELIATLRTFCDENERGTNSTIGGDSWRGYNSSEHHRARMRGSGNPCYGRKMPQPPERRAKISATKRKRHSGRKSVDQLTLDGAFIVSFESARFVERELGFNHSSISQVCLGKGECAYGFKWRFTDTAIRHEPLVRSRRELLQLSESGELIAKHTSLSAAADTLGVSKSAICRAANGYSKTSAGYIWRYEDGSQQ